MNWVTRARPKVDRVACPWLIKRFVDPNAEFLYVPPEQVIQVAKRESAIPFDVANVAGSSPPSAVGGLVGANQEFS